MSEFNFTRKSFELLSELKRNNHKAWFDEHREEIKENLQVPFAALLDAVTAKLKRHHFPLMGGKQTMFRMNRDVRFSKDKSPYSTHVSGMLTESGTKGVDGALVYAHLDDDGGFLASGFYQLDTKVLNQIRDRMIEEPDHFGKIVKKLKKSGYEFSEDAKLKTMPRGYSEHEGHPLVEYLRLKNLILQRPQSKQAWIDGSILDAIVALSKSSSDFIIFGTEAIEAGKKLGRKKGV